MNTINYQKKNASEYHSHVLTVKQVFAHLGQCLCLHMYACYIHDKKHFDKIRGLYKTFSCVSQLHTGTFIELGMKRFISDRGHPNRGQSSEV